MNFLWQGYSYREKIRFQTLRRELWVQEQIDRLRKRLEGKDGD